MKSLLFIICFFLFSNIAAQIPIKVPSSTKLTAMELSLAKESYLKMMQTKTYIEMKSNISLMTSKCKLLSFPKGNFNFNEFITENLYKTDFDNIEEATSLSNSIFILQYTLMEENKELYDLIKKCSIEQLSIIMYPEREAHENRKLFASPK